MELNVTAIVESHLKGETLAKECSGSVAELGPQAGIKTWANCLKLASKLSIVSSDKVREEIKSHFEESWDNEELKAFSDLQLGAAVIQEVMANIRQLESNGYDLENGTLEDWESATESEGGRLWKVEDYTDQWYYTLGV